MLGCVRCLPLRMSKTLIAIALDDGAHDLVKQEADSDRGDQANNHCLKLIHVTSPFVGVLAQAPGR